MTYHLGIDLGTTITTAAVHRDGRVGVAALGEHTAAMPSVLFWSAEGPPLVGDAAERRAAREPERAARAIRPRVADPEPFVLDGAPFAASALLGVVLRRVVDVVAAQEGGAPAATVLTHPASWGPDDREAFAGAAATLGLGEVFLVPEPEAAARQHAAHHGLRDGATVAVVDLGGGSVDATVLRHRSGGFTVLGRPDGVAFPPDAQPGDDVVVAGLHRALASAGVAPADLDTVVLVGWSTRIGSVAAALTGELGRPVAVDTEPEHAVAMGAARLAARSAEDGSTRAVAVPATRPPAEAGARTTLVPADDPGTGPVGMPQPAPPVPLATARASRAAVPGRRGIAAALAAGAIALGALGGGALALAGAASPASAAPAPVADVSAEPSGSAPPVEQTAEPAVATASPAPVQVAVAPAGTGASAVAEAPRSPQTSPQTSPSSAPWHGSGSSGTGHHESGHHDTGHHDTGHDTADTSHHDTDDDHHDTGHDSGADGGHHDSGAHRGGSRDSGTEHSG